jgi:O-antigen/teichoic acid export membrane protein
LAAATLAANGIALLVTIVFARVLGADGYGSLAALISAFMILSVPGSALQVATARETALGRLGAGSALAATLASWRSRVVVVAIAVGVAAALTRNSLAALIGVKQAWAAAATLTTACLWLLLSIERGALQGLRAYGAVAASIVLEAGGRFVLGLVLVVTGGGVTGAYLGTPLSMLATATVLAAVLGRRLGPPVGAATDSLRSLVRRAWVPMAGLTLIAVLQNVDVIMARHLLDGAAAGSYAAAAVAAKVVTWMALGVGFYLLPEAARLAADGADARSVLVRALAIIGAIAVPALVLFALAPSLLLRVAFGPGLAQAGHALPLLGVAMTLLAVAYLAVQYLLGVGRIGFLAVLAVAALAEPILLWTEGHSLIAIALIVLMIQLAAAASVLTLSARPAIGARAR